MECKGFSGTANQAQINVLIETLWNVKCNLLRTWKAAFSFNRNIVECKGVSGSACPSRKYCFNRNIVECKVFYSTFPNLIWLCFNRNIVECKVKCDKYQKDWPVVLIETLWNVKTIARKSQVPVRVCFNRNIVECKV